MLKLTKKADYGLMAMKHLAEYAHDDHLVRRALRGHRFAG